LSREEAGQRRVFIECTHTYLTGQSSGIRRVARALANAYLQSADTRAYLLPLVWGGRRFLRPTRPLTESPHPLLAWTRPWRPLRRFEAWLSQLLSSLLTRRAPWARSPLRCLRLLLRWPLRLMLIPPLTVLRALVRLLRRPTSTREGFYRLLGLLGMLRLLPALKPQRWRRGDIVVLVDSTWDSPAMLCALFTARRRDGIVVGAMLHDLFPLTIPHMCDATTVARYRAWFDSIIGEVDFVITNSQATTRALDRYLDEHPALADRSLPRGHFRLGADLADPSCSATPAVDPCGEVGGFVVLVVGTIEPRKNHTVILDAMDMLWDEHAVTLIVIGRPGWLDRDIIERMRGHPWQGTRLLHLDDVDDATLVAAYRRADALVCASWAEGFGLPIVEGLHHGLPVLASDIEAFREVGGDACRYFPPDSPSALAAELSALITRWQAGRPLRTDRVEAITSWHESAVDFRKTVLALSAASAPRVG